MCLLPRNINISGSTSVGVRNRSIFLWVVQWEGVRRIICLNDQAKYCLIHFYKRCVSTLVRALALSLSEGLHDSPIKPYDSNIVYVANLYYDVPLFLIIKFSPTSLARSIRIPCSQIFLGYGNEFFFVVISSCPRGDCLWINYRYLRNCHPDTEIFSKRRKIYSICLDSRDDNQDLTVRQLYQSRTSDR